MLYTITRDLHYWVVMAVAVSGDLTLYSDRISVARMTWCRRGVELVYPAENLHIQQVSVFMELGGADNSRPNV